MQVVVETVPFISDEHAIIVENSSSIISASHEMFDHPASNEHQELPIESEKPEEIKDDDVKELQEYAEEIQADTSVEVTQPLASVQEEQKADLQESSGQIGEQKDD